jgi:adenylate cyclase class 2
MPIETEKKYRLSNAEREIVLQRLIDAGAERKKEEFEENTIYTAPNLASSNTVLRLRRVGDRATLTYKQRLPSSSAIKNQREEETAVADPAAMAAILEALGITPTLVYEKRRQTWSLGKAEIVIDELPFGLFMEIEGKASEIERVERELGIENLQPEHATYPHLTKTLGKRAGQVIEARFEKEQPSEKA